MKFIKATFILTILTLYGCTHHPHDSYKIKAAFQPVDLYYTEYKKTNSKWILDEHEFLKFKLVKSYPNKSLAENYLSYNEVEGDFYLSFTEKDDVLTLIFTGQVHYSDVTLVVELNSSNMLTRIVSLEDIHSPPLIVRDTGKIKARMNCDNQISVKLKVEANSPSYLEDKQVQLEFKNSVITL
jgi:hypothetical protein